MIEYEVIITQRAYTSIVECTSFVRSVSQSASITLYDEIMSSIRSLTSFPSRYPEIQNLEYRGGKIRRMLIHNGRYCILYKIDDQKVIIYNILDCRKDNKLFELL